MKATVSSYGKTLIHKNTAADRNTAFAAVVFDQNSKDEHYNRKEILKMLYIETTDLELAFRRYYKTEMGGTAVVVDSCTGERSVRPIPDLLNDLINGIQIVGLSDTLDGIHISTITALAARYVMEDSKNGWKYRGTSDPLRFKVNRKAQAKRFPSAVPDTEDPSFWMIDLRKLENARAVLEKLVTPWPENVLYIRKESMLSNFYDCPVSYNGITFLCAETAFQCAKFTDEDAIEGFYHLHGLSSWVRTSRYKSLIRPDWEDIEIRVMQEVLESKFMSNPDCLEKLRQTKGKILIHDTTPYHENFWGECNCHQCIK